MDARVNPAHDGRAIEEASSEIANDDDAFFPSPLLVGEGGSHRQMRDG
jgi:hypothetical protein